MVTGKDGEFPTDLSRQIADLEDDVGMSANDVYDIREQVEDSFSIIGGNLSQIDSMDDIGYVSGNCRSGLNLSLTGILTARWQKWHRRAPSTAPR